MPHRILALVVACAGLLSAACSGRSTPSSPAPVAASTSYPDFSGLWHGDYRVTECSGERECVFRASGPDGVGAVRITSVTLCLDQQRGLSGSLSYSVDPSLAAQNYGMGVLSHTGVVIGAEHGSLPAASPTALAAAPTSRW